MHHTDVVQTHVPELDIGAAVTKELLDFIEQERDGIEPEAQPLLDELETLVRAGGKRIRPRFCYWGFRAAGGTDVASILRVGAALELLHTFALIHDDVMDQSELRRGRATTFRALAELSAGVEHRGDPKRFGMSAAILTGLLGFVLADRRFLTAGFSSEATEQAAAIYDRMRVRAIAGQYLDLLAAHRGRADEETARRIAVLKAGSYTVADPLCIGATFASGATEVLAALEAYGQPLGEAFQLRDDVLGVFGEPAVTGKDRSDLREGKRTVLLAKAWEMGDDAARKLLDDLVGDPSLTQADTERIREVVLDTGALDATNALIETLVARARRALESAPLEQTAAVALLALADEVGERQA